MKRKTRKRRRQAVPGQPPNIVGNALGKPFRQRKQPPTDIELTAKRITSLVSQIGDCRRHIGYHEQDLKNERSMLANLMVEHQEATGRIKELSLVPQPAT